MVESLKLRAAREYPLDELMFNFGLSFMIIVPLLVIDVLLRVMPLITGAFWTFTDISADLSSIVLLSLTMFNFRVADFGELPLHLAVDLGFLKLSRVDYGIWLEKLRLNSVPVLFALGDKPPFCYTFFILAGIAGFLIIFVIIN